MARLLDSEVLDENLITFDNGSNHYFVSEIEQFIEDYAHNRASTPA